MSAKKKKKQEHEDELHAFTKKDLSEKEEKKKSSRKNKSVSSRKKKENAEEDFSSVLDDEALGEELMQIYENGDGTIPDMTQFQKRQRSRVVTAFFTLLVSVLLLAGIAYAGFFVFQPQARFSEADVLLTVVGDESVSSGEQIHYRIRYRNAQRIPLAKVKVQVRYPEGFVFSQASVDPSNDKNTEWELGSLDGGASGFIDIYGSLHGDIDEKQSIRVFLNYTPTNFSSEFQKVASLTSETANAPVILTMTHASEVSVGAETEVTLTLRPDGDPVEFITLALDDESGFSFKESSLDPDEDNNRRWSIEKLSDEFSVTLTGTFQDAENGSLSVTVYQWKDADHSGNEYAVLKESQQIALFTTDISARLVMNGTLNGFTVQPGETLNASVIVKNIGDDSVNDVDVRLLFDAPASDERSLLNWLDIEDEYDGTIVGEQRSSNVRRGTITWNKSQIPTLNRLDPGEEVTIDITLPIKSAEDFDLTAFKTYDLNVVADVQFDRDGERETLASNQLDLVVNSDAFVATRHDIDEDTHTVTWLLTNTFHELSTIRVEGDIFGDIEWLEDSLVVPAGEAVFDANAKQLVWTIPNMPTSVDVLALQFAVRLKKENLSQTNLTSKLRFTATDTITGEVITLVGDEVLLNVEDGE